MALLIFLITSTRAFALTPVLNLPASNSIYNGTIILNATTNVGAENATFYYSNTANPFQYMIAINTTSGTEFTYNFDTRNLVDGTYNFTVNVTNSTGSTFDATNTNITIDNPPRWSNNLTSVASGSQYSPGGLYQFNISWNDGFLNHVSFESNYTLDASTLGVFTNYSSPGVSNSSGVFWINLTDLPAQTFVYRWIANDTSGNSNSTSSSVYIINKNSSSTFSLTLDGVEGNNSYKQYQNATFTANLNVPNKTIFLNSSYPTWTNITNTISYASNTTNLTSIGTFSVKSYWDGDVNYTTSNKTYYFTVTDVNFSSNSVSQTSPAIYSPNQNYGFSIKWIGSLSKVIFEGNFNGTTLNYTNNNITITNWNNKNISISNDTSGNYWINFTDLPAAIYNYRWVANDTNNIWSSTGQLAYIISQLSVTPSFTYSGSGPPWTTTTSTSVVLTCSDSRQLTLTISPCSGTLGGSGNSVTCSFTTGSTSGSTLYTCTVTSINHTGSTSGLLSWAPFQSSSPGTNPGTTQNTTGSFTITSSSSSITMEPNSSKVVTFTLSNKFSYDIISINLSVSGIDSSWYSLDKTSILRLRHDSGVNTTQLTLNVPSDAERKIYSIVFTASGKDFNLNKITRQTTVSLRVPAEVNETNLNETNETANETTEETISNETNITTGSANENNGILNLLTGLSIKPEDFKNVVLFVGLIAVGLIFLFRSNITEFLTSSAGHKVQKGEAKEEKKTSKISSLKNKLSKYSGTRLVIHVKKEEKKEKEKV